MRLLRLAAALLAATTSARRHNKHADPNVVPTETISCVARVEADGSFPWPPQKPVPHLCEVFAAGADAAPRPPDGHALFTYATDVRSLSLSRGDEPVWADSCSVGTWASPSFQRLKNKRERTRSRISRRYATDERYLDTARGRRRRRVARGLLGASRRRRRGAMWIFHEGDRTRRRRSDGRRS